MNEWWKYFSEWWKYFSEWLKISNVWLNLKITEGKFKFSFTKSWSSLNTNTVEYSPITFKASWMYSMHRHKMIEMTLPHAAGSTNSLTRNEKMLNSPAKHTRYKVQWIKFRIFTAYSGDRFERRLFKTLLQLVLISYARWQSLPEYHPHEGNVVCLHNFLTNSGKLKWLPKLLMPLKLRRNKLNR